MDLVFISFAFVNRSWEKDEDWDWDEEEEEDWVDCWDWLDKVWECIGFGLSLLGLMERIFGF